MTDYKQMSLADLKAVMDYCKQERERFGNDRTWTDWEPELYNMEIKAENEFKTRLGIKEE